MSDHDRTASLLTPAKLAQMKSAPAASPAAWLDQMAADAGHQHLRQLGVLRERLQEQLRGHDDAALREGIQALAEALGRVDFSLLQPRGWLARATGKGRSAGAQFAAQHDEATSACDQLQSAARAFAGDARKEAGSGDRALVEFEVEFRALEKVVDQGGRWLQDMHRQLKARQEQGADPAAIRADAARCEILLARLKHLRAAGAAAQQLHQQATATAARRSALVESLLQQLPARVKAWQARLGPLAGSAAAGGPALDLEGPTEALRALQDCLQQLAAECEQVTAQERAVQGLLAEFESQLQPPAAP